MNVQVSFPWWTIYAFIFLFVLLVIWLFFDLNHRSLNVKDKVVGQGQHGKARFLQEKELIKYYEKYQLPHKIQDMSNEWKPGRIIHFNPKTRDLYIDTSTTHRSTQAPTRTGKTTRVIVPSIQYHLMTGVSSVNLDIKGEIEAITRYDAEELNFIIRKIDFINVLGGIDLMQDINEYINEYMETGSIIAKANAETVSGELAENIVYSRKRGNNENGFFLSASKGLIQSIILLVSMFADKEEKHLSSVRSIIQSLSSIQNDPKETETALVKLLKAFPEDFSPKKIIGAAFAATSETKDNIYSSALSDLNPFNNAIVEQLISIPQKKDLFNYNDLIDNKTILYITIPEGKTEFYALAKIILKKIYEQCSARALKMPNGKLPKPIYLNYDEFGNTPQVENINGQLSVGAGKGLLFDLTYQDYSQLKEIYGDNVTRVIENNCETSLVLGIAPKDIEGAKIVSDASGSQTIQSASVSNSRGQSGTSQTLNMIERKLISIDEALKIGEDDKFLMLRRKSNPFKCYLAPYYSNEWGIGSEKRYINTESEEKLYQVHYLSLEKLKSRMNHYLNTFYKKEKGSPLGTTSGLDEDFLIQEHSKYNEFKRTLLRACDNDDIIIQFLEENDLESLVAYWSEHYLHRIPKIKLIGMIEHLKNNR